jgi:hypothetical protein
MILLAGTLTGRRCVAAAKLITPAVVGPSLLDQHHPELCSVETPFVRLLPITASRSVHLSEKALIIVRLKLQSRFLSYYQSYVGLVMDFGSRLIKFQVREAKI